MDVYINYVISSLPATKSTLEKIRTEQENDSICIKLKEYCLTKWPSKDKIDKRLNRIFSIKAKFRIAADFCFIIRG